jgi:hypothetical protein
MTTQANGPQLPAVAVAPGGAAAGNRDTAADSTDDAVPVGAADAEADAVRSGARGGADTDPTPGNETLTNAAGDANATDDGVPVGEADAEADRRRTAGDDDGA